jgi:transketolase
MRDAFVTALSEIARQDKNVMLLTGDLGFGVLTKFAHDFPSQYLNAGVAEQNMTGLATGMALEGKTVFNYSIGNFPTLRCLEQIRNDVCYHHANVKIVSIGGGFCYGSLGISHHATEDLAIMRALPNLTVLAPGDLTETMLAVRAAYDTQGPCYLRLGRGNEPRVHDVTPMFLIGKAIPFITQGDIALLSTGGILDNVVKAHKILKDKGIDTAVYSVPSLKPFDSQLVEVLSATSKLIVTVEEHSIIGGLGGAVAEVLAEMTGERPPLMRIGLNDCFSCEVGDQEYLRHVYGLSPEAIAERVQKAIQ